MGAQEMPAPRTFLSVDRQTVMPEDICIGLSDSGDLKVPLAGKLVKLPKCFLIAWPRCFPLGDHPRTDVGEHGLDLRPLFVGQHGNRHLAAPAVVGLGHRVIE